MFEGRPSTRTRSVIPTKIKVNVLAEIQGRFDWDATANDQENLK